MKGNGDKRDARRVGVLLLAVAQLCGPVGLQAMDAILDSHGVEASIHVEGQSREACGVGHTHLMCQTVRSLTMGIISSKLVDSLEFVAFEFVETENLASSRRAPRNVISGTLGSRAPPLT